MRRAVMTDPTVDALALAAIIRKVDGNHDLGAGALADAILAALADAGYVVVRAEEVRPEWLATIDDAATVLNGMGRYGIATRLLRLRAALATKETP